MMQTKKKSTEQIHLLHKFLLVLCYKLQGGAKFQTVSMTRNSLVVKKQRHEILQSKIFKTSFNNNIISQQLFKKIVNIDTVWKLKPMKAVIKIKTIKKTNYLLKSALDL